MLMVKNAMYVVVLIFYLTVLDSNSTITSAIVDVEDTIRLSVDMI